MSELSEDARKLLKDRYCRNTENYSDVFPRVAHALGKKEDLEKEFLEIMENKKFLPNSPTLRNAGFSNFMSACFVLPIKDDMVSIFDALRNMAIIQKEGGGTGFNFSEIREKGAPLSSGGTASGALSFMKIFDAITDAVKQGGFRRGANMGILYPDHPEILDFIKAKVVPRTFTNFNFSVMVNDDFMKGIEKGETLYLRSRKDKRVIKGKIKMTDLFSVITYSAWISADPGLLFYDRINRDNVYREPIEAVNPCLDGDTIIQTTEGEWTLRDMAKAHRNFDVYSIDLATEKLIIKRATDIRCTRRKTEVVKVKTQRGDIICTPDHKFLVDGEWKEAQNLEPKDRLGFMIKHKLRNAGVEIGYKKHRIPEQSLVVLYYFGKIQKGIDTHHINGNRYDNSIINLQLLPHRIHSIISNLGHKNYVDNDNKTGKFIKKETHKKRDVGKDINDSSSNAYVISVEKINNRDVFNMIVEDTHNFIANRFVSKNCGEQPLLPFENCCLGSINLNELVEKNEFNWDEFKRVVEIGTKFLLAIKKYEEFPIDELYKMNWKTNRIGLGVMGFSDALVKMHIKYDSEEALHFIDKLGKCMKPIAKRFAPNSASVLSIAPTGSLSILASCSAGIEPPFSQNYERRVVAGTFKEKREDSEYLRTAMEISPEWHLKVQAHFQHFVDSGVSKTVNLPEEATIQDIRNIYYKAWKMGAKGVTVYRNRSKEEQVMYERPTCDDGVCYL